MVCDTFSEGSSAIHRLDPRARVVAAVAFSLLVAVSTRFIVLGAGLAAAVALGLAARLPLRAVAKRLAALNAFMLLLWLILPFTAYEPALFHIGPLGVMEEGVRLAACITLKANAIVLALTVFLGTLEVTTLGHALVHLRVPEKLAHLFLFTVRYIDMLHHEYRRLRSAMKVRCFRPRMSRHTYRTYGYLVGMLLVKSLDRSDRIVAAMKCRGFRGRFYVLDHFAFARRDAVFGAMGAALLIALGLLEWL